MVLRARLVSSLALTSLLVLPVVLAPRVVRACGAIPLALPISTPASGAELPANAAIRFDGPSVFGPPFVAVTVDGAPAAFEGAAEFPNAFAVNFLRITPRPSPGQTVVVAGDFCASEESPCEASFSFVVAAPDTTMPVAAAGLEFDLQQFPEAGGAGSCLASQDHAWFARWDSAVAGANESEVVHVLEIAADEGFAEVLGQELVTAGSGSITARIALLADEAAPEGYCLRVRTLDLAGNESASETVCTPLHCLVEPDDFDVSQGARAEPAWTDADAYAGGPCGSAPKSSCECATRHSVPPAWLLWAVVPLVIRRRSRG